MELTKENLEVFKADLEKEKVSHKLPFTFKCLGCGLEIESNLNVLSLKKKLLKRPGLDFLLCTKCYLSNLNKDSKKIEEGLRKREKTNLEKYGVRNITELKSFQEKKRQTCLEKYGDENFNNSSKRESTNLKKYGCTNPMQLDSVKEDRKSKTQEKLGVDFYSQTKSFKDQVRQTWESKSPEERKGIRRKSNKHNKYKSFDGEVFDSLWELKYYEYCKSKGLNIIREPVSLEYFYLGKLHTYYPDFEVDGKLVEIKGNHLKDSEGKWFCPYKDSNHSKDYLDGLYEAKRQCALSNSVTILYQEDLIKLGIKL